MQYTDGQQVKIGDRVSLGNDSFGVVVCSIDAGEYTETYPEAAWSYLNKGVLVEFEQYGLIHYESPEPDLKLVSRA